MLREELDEREEATTKSSKPRLLGCYREKEGTKKDRNMREEAARIVGQKVESIDKLKAKNFDALFVMGGMGVNAGLTDYSEK